MKVRNLFNLILLSTACIYGQKSFAQNGVISLIDASTYTQNFDLPSSTTLPAGISMTGNGSAGVYLSTVAAVKTSLSSSEAGASYKYDNAGDMAVGFLASNSFSAAKSIKATIENNTGATITDLNITFNYEKYRDGKREWTFNFYTNGTLESTGSHVFPADAANGTGTFPPSLTVPKTVTITGLSIAPGSTYELQWDMVGTGGNSNSQALSIDDLTITPTLFSCPAPSIAASNVDISNIDFESADVTWTNGDGDSRLVFVKASSNPLETVPITDGTDPSTMLANTTYGLGTEVPSSGWYCIYNGTGSNVSITGLGDNTTYSIAVVELANCSGAYKYNTTVSTDNPDTFTTQQFGDISSVQIDATSFCNSTATNAAVSFNSTLSAGDYYVELSDETGSFATATLIGTGASSPVTVSIPSSLTAGSNYLVRVINNTNGYFESIDNAGPITISEIDHVTGGTLLLCEGGSGSFDISSQTTGVTSIQWLKDGFIIPGETNAVLNFANVTAIDAASYQVERTIGACTDISDAFDLTVSTPEAAPTLSANSTSFCEGSPLIFTIDNPGNFSLAFYFNNGTETPISIGSGTSVQHTISALSSSDNGDYYATITNGAGCSSTSNTINIATTASSIAMASTTETEAQPANSTIGYNSSSCERLAVISGNDDLGNVTVDVTVGTPTQVGPNGDFYVGRYYEINVDNQPVSATDVSLFFTSADFNDYNAVTTPGNEVIVDEIGGTLSNLFLSVFHGTDIPGSGLEELVVPSSVSFNGSYWTVNFSISQFSTIMAHGGNVPLPIILKSIAAKNSGNENVISWTIGGDCKDFNFELERSNDGRNFEFINQIEGSKGVLNYKLTDAAPFNGINYYRLLMKDEKGVKYSKIVTAIVGNNQFNWSLYPNPVKDNLTIQFEKVPSNASISLIDVTGRVIKTQAVSKTITTVSFTDVNAGIYWIKYQDYISEKSAKVIVTK